MEKLPAGICWLPIGSRVRAYRTSVPPCLALKWWKGTIVDISLPYLGYAVRFDNEVRYEWITPDLVREHTILDQLAESL